MDVNVIRRSSIHAATVFVKSGIWTHALSQELELESSALDRSAILTLNVEWQKLLIIIFKYDTDVL